MATSDRRFGEDFGPGAHRAPHRLSQALKETVPATMLPDRWLDTADADEFLVLPSGISDLGAFAALRERPDQPYASAPMVDFYGETLDGRN